MKGTSLPKDPHSHTGPDCQKKLRKKRRNVVLMTDCENKPLCSIYRLQFTHFWSRHSFGACRTFHHLFYNLFLNVFFFFFLFSARWSCGAEQRSAWKKQPKRSLSQEQSATTSCVMWPIGRKSTSKPRWLEKRYTSFYIQRRFLLAQKDSVFAHSEPLHKVRRCDASLSPLLCILALSRSRSHLVYRLHFIWNIWIRAGNIAESSAAAQLCHLTKADRKHTDL